MLCVSGRVDAGSDGDASIAFGVMDRSWTGCILYRSLQLTLWPTRGSQKVETTLDLAFCRRKGHVTFAMAPIAPRLGTGRSASVADLSGSARIACCLRGKAAISQSARVPWKLRDCETAQAAEWATRPEPLLSKRWIGPPRCAPRKVDPESLPSLRIAPRLLVRPPLQVRPGRRRQVTCRIRSGPRNTPR